MGGDKSCAEKVLDAGVAGLLFGMFAGASEIAWYNAPMAHKNHITGMSSIVSRVASRSGVFSILGVAYVATQCTVDTLLDQNKWESTAAGCASAGLVVALVKQSPLLGISAAGAGTAALLSYRYIGNINGDVEKNWASNHPDLPSPYSAH